VCGYQKNHCCGSGQEMTQGIIADPQKDEERRRKMSKAKNGENPPMLGRHPSEESRKKMSAARKGKPRSEETRKKMSEAKNGKRSPMSGRHSSEETRRELSAAPKGVQSSEEIQREKQAAHQLHLMRRFQQKLTEAIYGKNRAGMYVHSASHPTWS